MSEEAKTLEWHEHIRLRPGMYIDKIGNGSNPDDGMYVLIKEVMDNSVDEFMLGYGKRIELNIDESSKVITVRDYGRGISFDKLFDAASKKGYSTKSNSKSFKKSANNLVLDGIGLKVVNAMSSFFQIQSFYNKRTKTITFSKGLVVKDAEEENTNLPDGTLIEFIPDETLFGNYWISPEYVIQMIKNYTFLNVGLTIFYNRNYFISQNGLLDLLCDKMILPVSYSSIHLKNNDIELAIHYESKWGTAFYSFVNGLYTKDGTHMEAFREVYVETIRAFFCNNYKVSDILSFITVAISIKIQEPVFYPSQYGILGSKYMYSDNELTIREYITDFVQKELTNYLDSHADVAAIIRKNIDRSQKGILFYFY